MKTLILYYSLSGNTRQIAEMIHEKIGGDLVRIETVVPYSDDYNQVVNQGKEEVESGYCPAIKPLNVDMKNYDTILLGTPVWWYTMAPAVHSFLKQADLAGKTIYPFATNGGWLGHTFEDLAKDSPQSTIKPGISIKFVKTTLRTPKSDIEHWIKQIQ